MSNSKFVPPTEFPSVYKTRDGGVATAMYQKGVYLYGHYGEKCYPIRWFGETGEAAAGFGEESILGSPIKPARKKTVWVNVYEEGDGLWCSNAHNTLESAKGMTKRIGFLWTQEVELDEEKAVKDE